MRKDKPKLTQALRARRHRRVRGKVKGTAERPRLSVFRSSKRMALQLIDDETGRTLAAITSAVSGGKLKKSKRTKTEFAKDAGTALAKAALAKGITRAVFDRGGYQYHGRVKAAAEGAREGGLQF